MPVQIQFNLFLLSENALVINDILMDTIRRYEEKIEMSSSFKNSKKKLSGEARSAGIPPQMSSGSFRMRHSTSSPELVQLPTVPTRTKPTKNCRSDKRQKSFAIHTKTANKFTNASNMPESNLLEFDNEMPRPDPAISPSATINFMPDDEPDDIFSEPIKLTTDILKPIQSEFSTPDASKLTSEDPLPIQFQYSLRKVFEQSLNPSAPSVKNNSEKCTNNLNLDTEVNGLMENLYIKKNDVVVISDDESVCEDDGAQANCTKNQLNENTPFLHSLINIDAIEPADRDPLVLMNSSSGLKLILQFAANRIANVSTIVITTTNESRKAIQNYSLDVCASKVSFLF